VRPNELFSQALALHGEGRKAEARAAYLAILQANPDHPAALANFALLVKDEGNAELAQKLIGHALHLDPHYAEGWSNLGLMMNEAGRPEAAIEALQKALSLKPGLLDANRNLALALNEAGRLEESLLAYDKALSLAPKDAHLRWGRACLLLLMGDFSRGWEEYEARWNIDGAKPPQATGPEWNRETPAFACVLVHAEQGFGDTIQFLRFVFPLIERGHRVELRVQDKLVRLLGEVGGINISGFSSPLPKFDCQIPLLSLPRLLGNPPTTSAYLSPEPELVKKWQPRLPQEGLKIGIAWQGTPNVAVDRGRSAPLAAFAPLFKSGVKLISLQKHHGLEQLPDLPGIIDLGPEFDSGPDAFIDAAAVIASLDLVVSTDTAMAHLASALGHPVWLALKKVPEWRWGMTGEESPWYPSMRIFRQEISGDWGPVFAKMAHELKILHRT
jgi:Flp pilus assembly protein TadD